MLSQVIVMGAGEFQKWYEAKDEKTTALEELKKNPTVGLMEDYGCLECHSIDDSKGERVPLKGIYGQIRFVQQRDGSEKEVKVDEEYLRRAIMDPGAEVLKGQMDLMEAADDLTDEELKMIIDFLKEHK
jgi:cytochrome c oxidase subunit 2